MNRYIVIDLKELCISHLAKVETDFDINEVQTSSITCTDEEDLIKELKKIISEMENWTTKEMNKMFDNKIITIQKVKDLIYALKNEFDNELDYDYESNYKSELTDVDYDIMNEYLNRFVDKLNLTINDELKDELIKESM